MAGGARQVAVDQLAASFDGVLRDEGDIFTGFDCTQADLLAFVLVLHGHPETAAHVLVRHCEGDDAGDDPHGRMREHCNREIKYGVPAGDGKAIEIARGYLADMGLHVSPRRTADTPSR